MTPVDPLDLGALEALARRQQLPDFLAAWAPRLAGLASGGDDDRARHWVLRALRLVLPSLVSSPGHLFALLYQHLRWLDDPASWEFYSPRGEPPGARGPASLLAERWRQGREGAWARPLRPPPFRMTDGLLEECWGVSPEGSVAFSADGRELVFSAAKRSFRWERGTGRVAKAQALPEEPSGWRIVRSTWGKCSLSGPGEEPIEVALDEDTSIRLVTTLPGGEGLLLGGWGGEGEGVMAVVEGPSFEKIRWRVSVHDMVQRMVVTPDGRWALVVESACVSIVRVLDGKVLGRLPGSSVGVAVDASGELLARVGGGVAQIWDAAALLERPPGALRSARGGWMAAEFSPDRRRLLTGKLLCDAGSGQIIAELDLDGPGYLEGGPPSRAQRLTDRRYIEMAPMRGVCVFETERGERVLQDRSRSYNVGRDEIEISPDGMHYVHFPRDDGEATLRRVDDGLPLASLAIREPFIACFSADGRRVAVGSHQGMIGLWSVPSGRLVARFEFEGDMVGLWLSRSGDRVVAGAIHSAWRAWTADGLTTAEKAPEQDAMEFREAWGVEVTDAGPFELREASGVFEVVRREDGRVAGLLPAWASGSAHDGDRGWASRLGHWRLEEGPGSG